MQMISLSISSNRENKLELRRSLEQPFVPGADAFGPRRLVGAKLVIARKTEAHRHDGDFGFVVENVPADVEPGAQPLARGVVVGNAGFVNAQPRRLPGDAQPRRLGYPQDRPDAVGQVFGANPARPDFGEQFGQRLFPRHDRR